MKEFWSSVWVTMQFIFLGSGLLTIAAVTIATMGDLGKDGHYVLELCVFVFGVFLCAILWVMLEKVWPNL